MIEVALVQFVKAGKTYYFGTDNLAIKELDYVVVETVRGLEIGQVRRLKRIELTELNAELKPVLRVATPEDLSEYEYNEGLEQQVVKNTKELVINHKLEMKILAAEYTLDRKKLLIYFEAEKRIDFRELVRNISEIYHTRIELRQIGSRDAAKIIGGIGPCGMLLCCSTFLGEFLPVSIRMAKNQSLSLNPQQISGVCGKLLCCIKYEDDTYTELKRNLPDINQRLATPNGNGLVLDVNILKQEVKVRLFNENEIMWFKLSDVEIEK